MLIFVRFLLHALLYKYGDNLSDLNGEFRRGIVHRLDRNTSGLIMIAKQKIHEALYGNWGDFTFTVLEQVDKDKLSEREKFYIDLYESNVYGYNLKKGG